jgi:hypothetical protein
MYVQFVSLTKAADELHEMRVPPAVHPMKINGDEKLFLRTSSTGQV